MEQRYVISGPERQSSSSSYLEEELNPCQNCCKSFVCCICCCKYIHKATRIKIIWGLCLLAATASCVILGCVVFRADTPFAAPTDMRAVTNNVNFLFCEEVTISSPGLQFDAFRISGDIKIDEDRRKIISYSTALLLEGYDYDYYTFYFLDKSKFSISHSSKQSSVFYVFQGRDNFRSWKNDKDCEECYVVKIYLQGSLNSFEGPGFNMTISSEDIYFIVYDNQHGSPTWVDITLNLNRTVYDLTDAVSVCDYTTDCSVILNEKGQTAIYQVASYENIEEFRHPEFTTYCVPRIWSYLLFHGVFVLVVGISCSVLIHKLCTNPDSDRHYNIMTNENTPLLYGTRSPPAYSNVIMSPPKYDDAIRYSDPPSYSEVTRHMRGYSVNETQRTTPKLSEDTVP